MQRLNLYKLHVIILLFLVSCSSGPTPPPSNLPPSASDLDLLGLTRLCDKMDMIPKLDGKQTFQQSAWGTGKEWYTETTSPTHRRQWLFFNDDETLVAVVSTYPSGLTLEPYPVLRDTLSQLTPAREFFENSDSLIQGTQPNTVLLYRTGDEKSTTQYLIREDLKHESQLLVAVVVLDPYEQLLDGAQKKFMAQPNDTKDNTSSSQSSPQQHTTKFLATQQFARGEIALFESCPGKKPDIAIDAYRQTIQLGLEDPKRLAEAHHRLGLALRNKGQLTEAKLALEESLKIQQYSPRVLNSLGTVLVQLKDPVKAIELLERAITLQPNYARARYNLAEAYESVNRSRAIEEYETYLALVENIPEEATRAALATTRLEKLK
ncbi:tetratricopeptide repeat protein [Nitrospira sp. M1]